MAQAQTDNLALNFQEVLTAVVRLRANRQSVSDAETFRHHMREALKLAAAEAQRCGYAHDDIKLAAFATVALLDESILNSQDPLFADWPRKPLQEEMFGIHVAGETFFQYLQQLLSRNDSRETGDVLEVYHLCLLLGYRGRYSAGGRGELQAATDAIAAKIRRIRGAYQGLAPEWALPSDPVRVGGADPWVKKLTWAAIACLAVALVLFVVFKLGLSSGVSDLRQMVSRNRSLTVAAQYAQHLTEPHVTEPQPSGRSRWPGGPPRLMKVEPTWWGRRFAPAWAGTECLPHLQRSGTGLA